MEDRPVIILGAGLWGSLLAYRLSLDLPEIKFKIYSTSGSGSDGKSWAFREQELSREQLRWLKPLISYSWGGHQLLIKEHERILLSPVSVILPGQFETALRKTHCVERLGNEVTMEELLHQGAFIIDTRPEPGQKSKCYRHTVGLLVELSEEHGLEMPITMDSKVRQNEIFRHMQYFPINSHTVLVKDVRYGKESSLHVEEREEELLWEVSKRWKIKEILHQETESIVIPSGKIRPWNYGRVISLTGILNPVTAEQFTEAVKVVDLMVKTSFRFGELKDAIQKYRSTQEQSKRLSRFLVKMIYHSPQPAHRMQFLEYLFKLSSPMVEKFLNGTLNVTDLGRALLMRPSLPLLRAIGAIRIVSNKSTKLEELTPKEV